jgi:hypothetical protein
VFSWIPTYLKPASYHFSRVFCSAFSLVWWHMEIESYGQETILRDIGFGGYHWHIRFTDGFWTGEGDRYNLQSILTDFWVELPGGGLDPNPQPIAISYRFHPETMVQYIQFKNTAVSAPPFEEMIVPLPVRQSPWYQHPPGYGALPKLYTF